MSFSEKYKPKSLSSGIAGHEKAIATLQRLLASKLFGCGPEYIALIEHYKRIVKADKGNLRASLQRVEMGEFACSL